MQPTDPTLVVQAPADKPRLRRWVWRCTVVVVAVPLLLWLVIVIDQQRQPVYEGRRVGEWFDDLGASGGGILGTATRRSISLVRSSFPTGIRNILVH